MNGNDDDYVEAEKKMGKRGFSKIDVVDIILSEEGQQTLTKSNNALFMAPTYRMEPKKKFDVDVVYQLLKEFMDKHCSEFSYNEKECQNACKRISYYIRRAVKQLSFDRYRFICQVRIIEKQNQGIETQIGFLWCENFDGYACYTVDTYSFMAQAVVFGIYKE
ncbi:T complex testis-specific protein, putative [Pediculus humanus corporis]|uniref:T complex testis-specific protein, putative n=1 Tax=Pediculus humanus subsp. corporis TaxID=121224 RepID=E0VMH7_PEDHC|nr:T complex testis-specific protein, putative [Pediculus humanus corporis]EEB14583.1 T complex testis-specific protein, putative [Pediculus humanus corporis]